MNASIFVDSNLWLYAFVLRPGEETKHARALALVEARSRYTISTQVVARRVGALKDRKQACSQDIASATFA